MIRPTMAAFALSGIVTQASADVTWGVNGHPLTAYPDVTVAEQLDLVADLGMKSYRINISSVEQADYLETIVAAAAEREIDILPVLTAGGLDFRVDSDDSIYRKAFAFAETLGKRFADQIPVWELGNEEENHAIIQPCEFREDGSQYPCEWGPAGGVDALDYHGKRWNQVSALLRGLSDGLDAADPDAIKAMGTAGWGHLGAFERMRRDGIDWDISVWHIYGEDPEWAFKILEGFHRPIWVTELNHPYGSRDGEKLQADGLVEMMRRLRELSTPYQIEAVHIYELLDESYWAPDFESVMGLVTLIEAPEGWMIGPSKPAYSAVREEIGRTVSVDCADIDAITGLPVPERQAAYGSCLAIGGTANAGQIETWAKLLANGEAVAGDMFAELTTRPGFLLQNPASGAEGRSDVVSLYRALLGREPEPQGLMAYSEQISSGTLNREDLARTLVASDEFLDRHPLFREPAADEEAGAPVPPCDTEKLPRRGSNAERIVSYVSCLTLSREPQQTASRLWDGAIEDGTATPLDLLEAVLQSAVFAARHRTADLSYSEFVGFAYTRLLGREPDGSGGADYLKQLEAGSISREDLLLALAHSNEFAERHPLLGGSTVDESSAVQNKCGSDPAEGPGLETARYVAYIHCLLLGSEPDRPTLLHWTNALKSGQSSREELALSLFRSPVFVTRHELAALTDPDFVTLIFRTVLGRDPDGAGLEAYVQQLGEKAIARENVLLGTLNSSEFAIRYASATE